MVFLCFSSKDRFTAVDSILYHLKQYGVKVWYDYHELTLGDDRHIGNFEKGLDQCDYAVVVLSPNMIDCKCGNDELDYIHKRYHQRNIHVFPLFYNITAAELPNKYKWMTELIYNEINDGTGTLSPCRQIVYKLISDITDNNDDITISDYLPTKCKYLDKMIESYLQIDDVNHNAKASILYSIYLLLEANGIITNDMCRHTANRIYQETKLNISYPHKELLILEQVVITALDAAKINNHHIF